MITLIHGSDYVASRKFFNGQKDSDSITLDAINLEGPALQQFSSGASLFSEKHSVFIENLFNRKAAKNLSSIVSFLNNASDIDVYIWADKEVSGRGIEGFPKYTDQNFKISTNIFGFVDRIFPRSKQNVANFHNVIATTDPEIVFSMIVRQFRLMLGLLGGSKNADEVKRLADWQLDKLRRQSSMFGVDNLKKIYKKLYKIDKSQKTGASKLSLIQAIDILLLEI